MKSIALLTVPLMTSFLSLGGCDGGYQLADLSDFDLEQKYAYCLDKKPTAPGKMTGCENLRKECESRAEQGRYICRTY